MCLRKSPVLISLHHILENNRFFRKYEYRGVCRIMDPREKEKSLCGIDENDDENPNYLETELETESSNDDVEFGGDLEYAPSNVLVSPRMKTTMISMRQRMRMVSNKT